jgi:multiple sugar transport system substrate-binding protein
MATDQPRPGMSRRAFIEAGAAAALLAACGSDTKTTTPTPSQAASDAGVPTETTFRDPAAKLSGGLSILLWSHFVPAHDTWFDPFVKDWGQRVGVNVTVDHINNTEIPGRIAAEIAANQGHDLIQYIAPLSQFEPSVLDLKDVVSEVESRHGKQVDICRKTSLNPHTGVYYAYSPGWVPDPGDYRKSLWQQVGMADGPKTWDDLLTGGTDIVQKTGVHMGIGMSQEIDSNMAARAMIWSFGGSEQDENENVAINSDATVAAVEYMVKLYKQTMTEEVFAWNPASNNQGLIAGQLSYIINSISAWRTAQDSNPTVADDVFFVPALRGPSNALAAQHVLYNWIVPKFATNPDAAKEFLLHYTLNFAQASFNSKLYDFPAFPNTVPQLDAWLGNDPFSQTNKDRLKVLSYNDALKWTVNIGHPGSSSPAIGEVFGTFVLPNMMAKAVRGELSPKDAVADAEGQIKTIYQKWRGRGLVGGDH